MSTNTTDITELNQKTMQLANLILDFTKNSIMGTESGLYKTLKQLVRSPIIKNVQMNFLVEYFNGAYRAIILNGDQYFVSKFSEMHNILDHSYICLLNITFAICIQLVEIINRDELDISSYDNYMESLAIQITNNEIFKPEVVAQFLSHTCQGIDIKTCDPNEPMFYAKEKEA